MRINVENINHNAMRLIDNIIGEPLEYVGTELASENDPAARAYTCTIGEVRGVLLMAEAMKEALEA